MKTTLSYLGRFALLLTCCAGLHVATAQTVKKSKTSQEAPVAATREKEVLPVLEQENLDIAERVQTGVIACELGQSVNLQPHAQASGHFLLGLGRQTFVMQPVPTSSGAVRLEDMKSGAVWLQLANKSMLMDQRRGKRLADACVTPQQLEVARALIMYPAKTALD